MINQISRYSQPLTSVFVLVGGIFAWWAGCEILKPPSFLFPSPAEVADVLINNAPMLAVNAWYTVRACLIGFAIAFVVGVLMAIITVQSRVLEQMTYTLLISMNSIPKVAVAPLFIVWLGTGLPSKVAVTTLVALFPIVVETVHGLKSVPSEMLDLGRVMGASKLKLLVKIQLPHTLPYLFTGMKVGISLALVGAIVGEFVASRQGLGYVILVAQGQFDTPTIFAALAWLAALGMVLFYAVEVLERIALPWHVSRRREEVLTGASA